jgi:glycerophosphoryl diester phosphodiesterase
MTVHPFFLALRPTLSIAHRGGAALAPENTLLAFRTAVDLWRADMIELDVHVTSDGEIVVAHDAALERTTDGEGAIAERTFAEIEGLDAGYRFTPDGVSYPFRGLGVRVPALRAVLAEVGVRLNIDLKPSSPGVEDALAAALRRAGAVERVCVGSSDDGTAERLVRALPEACHFYPARALAATWGAVRSGAVPTETPYLVLDMPLYLDDARLLDERLLGWARSAGRWINVWTVDDAGEMRRLVAEGVGGIMTDRPDVLRDVLLGASSI